MICPKCKKDLPDEIAFCPYCMTKFVETEDYGKTLSIKKKVVPFVIAGIILLLCAFIFVFVLFGRNDDEADKTTKKTTTEQNTNENTTTTKNNTEEDSTSTEVKEDKSTVDMLSYCGTWYNKDFAGEDPELEGGNVLKIVTINEDTVIFDLCSFQAPPSLRVAELTGITAEIVDGEAEFIFGDDGWGNGGIGKLVFTEDEIYVNIKLTSISSDSLWQIGSDIYFKKVSEGYQNDTIDFFDMLGGDIQVLLSNLDGLKYTVDEYEGIATYFFEGIYVIASTYDGSVNCINVDYSVLPEGYRNKYIFTSGINGNSSFDSLKSKLGEPISTYEDSEDLYVSCFDAPNKPGLYFKIGFSHGKIQSIMYFYSIE